MQNTDSISVDEMDEIYSKLAEKNIEVVDDHAEEEEPENMDDEELTIEESELSNLSVPEGVIVDDPCPVCILRKSAACPCFQEMMKSSWLNGPIKAIRPPSFWTVSPRKLNGNLSISA